MSFATRLLSICVLAAAGSLTAAQAQAQAQVGPAGKAALAEPVPPLPSLESLGPPDAQRIALGRKLADMAHGEAAFRSGGLRRLAEVLPKQLGQDPEMAALEKQFPGILQYLGETMRPAMEKRFTAIAPLVRERVGAVYARKMNAASIEAAIAFYGSDAGSAFLLASESDMNVATVLKEAKESDRVSVGSVDRALNGASDGVLAKLSPAYQQAYRQFVRSTAGRMMIRANKDVPAVMAEILNQTMNVALDDGGEAGRALEAYMARYRAEHSFPAVPGTAQEDAATRLAMLNMSEPQIRQEMALAFGKAFDQHVAQDAVLRARYEAKPAMQAFVRQRVGDLLVEIAAAELPTLRQQLASRVRAEMSTREIADFIAFLKTPTGEKTLRQIAAVAAERQAAAERGTVVRGGKTFASELTSEDIKMILAYGPTIQKLPQLASSLREVRTQWFSQVFAANAGGLKQRCETAEAEYFEKENAR